jgi:hypothetical protein
MSDYRPADLPLPPDDFDGNRPSPSLSPADAAVFGGQVHLPTTPPGSGEIPPVPVAPPPVAALPIGPPAPPAPPAPPMPPSGSASLDLGQVMLNTLTLRRLRKSRLLSQQELVYEFQRRNIQVSIATIKRAETGHAVRFRIVRELARYFGVSFDDLLH